MSTSPRPNNRWNQGEREAAERGNPYEWGSPRWEAWNDGYSAALTMATAAIMGRAAPTPKE